MASFFENIFAKAAVGPIAELIVSSTDALLMGPDWSANLEVADLINTYESEGAKEAIKALKKRLGQEPPTQALTLTLLESLMKNCGPSFHTEVASKDFTAELVKVGLNKKTTPDVAHQLEALVSSWAADADFKRGPLGAAFIAAHAQLTAASGGAPGGTGQQMQTFNPLVARHGDHEFVASAAPQLNAPVASSTRGLPGGVAHHVAPPEPPGQVRLTMAPPAVPTGPLGAMFSAAPNDAGLCMVDDDPLPGTMAAAAPQEAAPRAGAEGRAMTAQERAEEEEEEEHALQLALAASLEEAHREGQSPTRGLPPSAPAPPEQPAPPYALGELERIKGDVATLQANCGLFAECLAACESAADVRENEVLAELLPQLHESQPRVLQLLEGGEVSDESLMVVLLEVHEQLSQCLAQWEARTATLPSSVPPPPSATAATPKAAADPLPVDPFPPAGRGAEGDLLGDLMLTHAGDLAVPQPPPGPPPAVLDLQNQPTLSPTPAPMGLFQPPPALVAGVPTTTPAAPNGMPPPSSMGAMPPPPMPPPPTAPPPMPPTSTPPLSMGAMPLSMPPPSMPPPTAPPPAFNAATMPTPNAPSAPPSVQILDL